MSQIKLEIGSTPTTPPAGFVAVYPKSDKKLYLKDEDGIETDLSSTGGSGVDSFEGRAGAVTAQSGDYTASQVTNVPHGTITHIQVQAAINHLEDNKAPIDHVGSVGVSEHGVADGTQAGFMSPSDFTKLSGVASGATANDTDANLKNRSNHTGTQLAGTISDFSTAADARVTIGIAAHVADSDPHPNYATDTALTAGIATAQARSGHTGTQLSSTISDFDSAAKSATVDNAITNGVTTKAPSQDAVFDALNDKVDKTGDSIDGTFEMVGDLNGTGAILFRPQDTDPPVPSSGVTLFADTSESLSWMSQSGYKTIVETYAQTDSRTYQLPDQDGFLMMDPMTTDGDIIYRNSSVASRLPIGDEDEVLRVVSGTPQWVEENLGQDFGGGSLGSATISGAVTLTQETYYNELTLGPGCSINTNGFNLYAKKLIATSAGITGAIHGNGNNGTNGSGTTGGAGGIALIAAVLGASGAGGNGANGSANAGLQGTTGTNLTTCNGGAGGASGNSGAGGTGSLAAGVAGGTVTNYTKLDKFVYEAIRGILLINGGTGGRGGNSGGGDGAQISRSGGGGGGGARLVKCYFGEIVTSASTPAGVVQANGGNGGTNLAVPVSGNVGGCGGAGGGGGGGIIFMYGKRTGPSVTNFLQANGGNGGNGGQGIGTGIAGNGGSGGNGGSINAFYVMTNDGTEVIGSVGSAGTAGSGASTPGVGGAGGVCQLTI